MAKSVRGSGLSQKRGGYAASTKTVKSIKAPPKSVTKSSGTTSGGSKKK